MNSTENELAQFIYRESAKYSEWELGDLYRTLARIEHVAKTAVADGIYVDPQSLLLELGEA